MTPLGPDRRSPSWLRDALRPGAARPRQTIDIGPQVPVWALRAACVAAAAGCTWLVASRPLHWVVAAALVAGTVLRPGSGAPAAFAVGVGLLLLDSAPGPSDIRVLALVLGLHLTLELATATADLSWWATIERSALAPHIGPFVAIQATSQATALVGGALATGRSPAPWLPVGAGAALAVLAWAVASRLRPRP